MLKSTIDVNVGDALNPIMVEVRLKGVKGFNLRMWLATKLLLLAAIVSPVKMQITSN